MNPTITFLVPILVYIATCVNGDQEVCDYSDKECVLNAAKTVYPKMVAGIPGVEPSDPLHKEEILVYLPRFSYKLHDATMTGLTANTFNYINFFKNGTFTFGITVSETKIEGYYELQGQIGDMILNGKGACKLIYPEHKIDFIGKYFTSKDFVDEKIHNYIGNFTFLPEVKGKASYEYENLTNTDKELTEDQLKKLDDAVHIHVITEFMQKHIDNIDDYLRIVPFNQVNGKST